MEKQTLNSLKGSLGGTGETRLRLNQNGMKYGCAGYPYGITNGRTIPGLEMTPKTPIIIPISGLGNPHATLE
jgi:hypothetical protein